jgi:hypothetical protein
MFFCDVQVIHMYVLWCILMFRDILRRLLKYMWCFCDVFYNVLWCSGSIDVMFCENWLTRKQNIRQLHLRYLYLVIKRQNVYHFFRLAFTSLTIQIGKQSTRDHTETESKPPRRSKSKPELDQTNSRKTNSLYNQININLRFLLWTSTTTTKNQDWRGKERNNWIEEFKERIEEGIRRDCVSRLPR